MDNLSDSFRGELDSVTSTDSLQLITDEFHLRHLSTPDVSNIELSKRAALLELENERLRVDLENARIDLNARIAANQGLKGKVTELFVEMQTVLQDKQRLQNTLTDTNNRLSAAEASAKWYQSQVHILMASKKSLQVEIDTYQGILKQRQRAIADVNAGYKKLSAEYTELAQQYQREKQEMRNAMKDLQSHIRSIDTAQDALDGNSTGSPTDMSMMLEATEDELRNTKAELKTLEQRLMGNEMARMSMENTLSKQRVLISSMEENMQKSETERNETADLLRKTQFEIQKLRSENETLQTSLLASKREQSQVEDAISHLRLQLTKMIAHYKLLKSKNAESEEKLSTMQDLANENKRLKTLSYKANSALFKKLREEKAKTRNLEQKFYCKQTNDQLGIMKNKTEHSLREYLKQVLSKNKDLQDQLKSITRVADESIDEGYGDSNSINTSSNSLDVPSPSPVNSVLLNNAVDVLARSKDFGSSMQKELNALRSKMETLRNQCDMLNEQKDHSGVNDITRPRDST
ncbi:nuclear mitotic apparatus protein 1-like isoform X1 [Temnothorax curvispinosus]|uniref:Nuclear mitotic apparatus protein 1-like isoform X1 n=1 Tax=Temnothorax curvispinosus TaxID=300111 RepID=A0A6J1QEP4_9HYME|nr:nuclear mitotic apparatus protein 1-like isoform X1 [Temnothorax curvispinosus]